MHSMYIKLVYGVHSYVVATSYIYYHTLRVLASYGIESACISRTGSSGSTQLICLSSEVRKQALKLLPNKRINDAKIVDHQGCTIIEAEKLLASA
jgi:hypothetical protein